MIRKILDGICAGILIAIGGSVYLSCDVKYVGAILFSVALLTICFKGYSLYTGKIGFMYYAHGKEEWSVLLLGLLGNLIATTVFGILIAYAVPALKETAYTICEAKLAQMPLQAFIRAIMCGILMYLAVNIYKDGKNITGILFCIPVFILSGFEHSVANMFYFAASGITSFSAFIYICIVILGNTVGALLFPFIEKK